MTAIVLIACFVIGVLGARLFPRLGPVYCTRCRRYVWWNEEWNAHEGYTVIGAHVRCKGQLQASAAELGLEHARRFGVQIGHSQITQRRIK